MHMNDYLYYLNSVAKKIPLLILNTGDRSPKCNLPNTLELRHFLHPWENNFRKIILPWPVVGADFTIRDWKPIPKISFMGFVPRIGMGSFFGQNFRGITKPIKSSVYINRKFTTYRISKMRKIFDVELVKRTTFSALNSNQNWNTLNNEYSESLANSDYVFCPRGFANSSARLYEVISSGATPIVITSGNGFPKIYSKDFWIENVLNLSLFSNWSRAIKEDWNNLRHDSSYTMRQVQSNRIFISELEINSYLNNLFRKYQINYI